MIDNTSAKNIIFNIVAESCFETEEDRALFLKSYSNKLDESYSLRHDGRGYGGELLSGIHGVVSWLMEIITNIPHDIAGDALKFWVYSKILDNLPNSKVKEADKIIKKIREYLGKQVK